jgi:UDP-N-acetylmuramate dehydrogenase
VISEKLFLELQKEYPNTPSYPVISSAVKKTETKIKIPAGWLIEKAGFKGKRFGNYGVHEKQALVLVNYGNATGEEIYQLAKNIQKTILKQFRISLEIEVNVIA